MRPVMHGLRGTDGRARRRNTERGRRAHDPRRAGLREAQEMFDYGASDDPC